MRRAMPSVPPRPSATSSRSAPSRPRNGSRRNLAALGAMLTRISNKTEHRHAMHVRVIPLVEFPESSVNEYVEGGNCSRSHYGRTKRHPDPAKRSQVFPHPDLETE